MLTFTVYDYYAPFIEDDDNIVSTVAQGELVLIYFCALAVYTSQEAGESRQAFSGVGFDVVLIFIFFTSSLVAAYVILLDVFGYSSLLANYGHVSQTWIHWRRSSSKKSAGAALKTDAAMV